MTVYSSTMDRLGRLVIPAQLRRKMGLKSGVEVLFTEEEGRVKMQTREQALKAAQDLACSLGDPKRRWSEELIRERRREAAREVNE